MNKIDLLARLPQDAPVIVVLPPLADTYETLQLYFGKDAMPEMREIAGLSGESLLSTALKEVGLEETETVEELLTRYGLGGDRPIGCVVSSFSQDYAVLLVPVTDASLFLKETGAAETSSPVEFEIAGEKYQGGRRVEPGLMYAIRNDYLVLGTDEAVFERVLANFDSPVQCLYGTEMFPSSGPEEIVVRFSPENFIDQLAKQEGTETAMPVLKLLAEMYDDAAISWNLKEPGLALRVMGHVRDGVSPGSVPRPLQLPAVFPEDVTAVCCLRITEGLKGFIRATIQAMTQGSPDSARAEGVVNLVGGMLGEEAGLAVTDAGEEGVSGLLVMQSPAPQSVAGLLEMFGTRSGSAQASDAVQEFAMPGSLFRTVYCATTGQAALLGLNKSEVEAALERMERGEVGTGPVPNETSEKGNCGFLYLNSKNLSALFRNTVPDLAATMLSLNDMTLTLEDRGAYRAVSLSDPMWATLILLPGLARARESVRRASSQQNLKQMAFVLMMYSAENPAEMFPAISPDPGVLIMSPREIYPEYLTDPAILIHPSATYDFDFDSLDRMEAEDVVTDRYYVYLSHVIQNEEEGLAWVETYRKATEAGESFDQDFEADGKVFRRFRDGIEKELVAEGERKDPDALALVQSRIPVIWERPGFNKPDGINVLFLDGHVEFVRPSNFPYTKAFMDALASLDDLKK